MSVAKILKNVLIGCLLFAQSAKAQQDFLRHFNQDLTPSPMVSALGTYGGIDVKKNTGGIGKSISLLDVKQGNLVYSPAINYFSTGIRVDDWGSRIGTGWIDNITAVITRTVKGAADERAQGRVGDGRNEFGEPDDPAYTATARDKIIRMSAHNTSLDGQYDEFSYNLFGLTGNFIIKNNKAVLLSPQDNIKIEIVTTSPTYQFIRIWMVWRRCGAL
ncbi:hypothetical protein ACDQ55_19635 [Chitinophaga sp. 30R24]|uniref:hypothetical protein n=1 Tax=Chitinophaga sp. 30R24 TaxID=3248838 RepID=UPI003B91298B